jgi:metal-responsive CopG/Arc/MetJ family transcriptional regulator
MDKEKNPSEKSEYERFSISLPTQLFHEFENYRKKNNLSRSDQSRSELIRVAMRDYLDKETEQERIRSVEKTSAVIILSLKHSWEGQGHDHDNISLDEHAQDHSDNNLDSILNTSYFTKPDTDLIKINRIEHYFHDIVISKIHVHLEHEKCMLIIPVKGSGKRIHDFYNSVTSLKTVLSYNLIM